MPTTPINNIPKFQFTNSSIEFVAPYTPPVFSTATTFVGQSAMLEKDNWINKKWDEFEPKFNRFFNNGAFDTLNPHGIQSRVKKTLKAINELAPVATAVQLTSDESVLISFKNEHLSVYLEYFPDNGAKGQPEYVVNAYKGKFCIIDNLSADLKDVFERLKQVNENAKVDVENRMSMLFNAGLSLDLPMTSSLFEHPFLG